MRLFDEVIYSDKSSFFVSRYRQGTIPVRNMRFEQFCDIVFGSKMTREELNREIC